MKVQRSPVRQAASLPDSAAIDFGHYLPGCFKFVGKNNPA